MLHNYLVNKAILKIDNKKRPRPVCSIAGNLMDDGGRPDIEFWYNGELWIADFVYAKEYY